MLRLYMDHHVHAGITRELRARGADVVTAYEDNHHEVDDATLLDRAHTLLSTCRCEYRWLSPEG